jgi:hypothetical protein
MTYLLYAAACWPLASIVLAAVICRVIHKAKVRQRDGINASLEA